MSELNRLSVENFKKTQKLPITVVLDEVRSTLNVGSVFRTSDAFLIEEILLCGLTPLPSREMNKTALGATDSVTWRHFKHSTDAIQLLKNEGYQIIAIEQTDQSLKLQDYEWAQDTKIALVFGHEVKGVSNEVLEYCDAAIEIPQLGTKHSLNISVSAGVVLWEFAKQYL